MTISKRSLLAVATTTTALILTACVAPPAAKPTPGPTTTAMPAPVVPRLCSEIGEDPAGVLGSPLLQQVAPAARSASPPAGSDTEPLDPDELPEPLDPDGVRHGGRSGSRTTPRRHGTHVAGTIAAIPNNSIGTAGVAPGVDIIDVKALTAARSSEHRAWSPSDRACGRCRRGGDQSLGRLPVRPDRGRRLRRSGSRSSRAPWATGPQRSTSPPGMRRRTTW